MNLTVSINGEKTHVPDGTNLKVCLTEKGLADKKGIAVAINQQIIPRSSWDSTILNQNDSVVVITATQGG